MREETNIQLDKISAQLDMILGLLAQRATAPDHAGLQPTPGRFTREQDQVQRYPVKFTDRDGDDWLLLHGSTYTCPNAYRDSNARRGCQYEDIVDNHGPIRNIMWDYMDPDWA